MPHNVVVPLRAGAIALACAANAACGTAGGPSGPEAVDDPPRWESFTIGEMRAELSSGPGSFTVATGDATLGVGMLREPAGSTPPLLQHEWDVLYFVVSGSGRLRTESTTYDVLPGSVYFVRGRIEHRFEEIGETLEALLFFPRVPPSAGGAEDAAFSMAQMVDGRDTERTVWRALHATSTLGVGMYMVPKGSRDNGERLVHGFDEVKMIVRGTARFDLGDAGMEVGPETLVVIGEGVPHRFRRVSDAIDVLVVWAP